MNEEITTQSARCVKVSVVLRDDSKAPVLVSKISGLITEICQYAGQTMSDANIAIAAAAYTDDLRREFGFLDTTEIRQIFHNGVRGRYGDYYGINARTFYQWTVGYVNSDEYLERSNRRVAEEKKALPPRDDDRYMRESINEAYSRWLQLPETAETAEAPAPGTLGAELRKAYRVEGFRHSFAHPLCDLHNAKRKYLNALGYEGELEDIFKRAKALGRKTIIKIK